MSKEKQVQEIVEKVQNLPKALLAEVHAYVLMLEEMHKSEEALKSCLNIKTGKEETKA